VDCTPSFRVPNIYATMTSFQKLEIKSFARNDVRATAENRYWRKFGVSSCLPCTACTVCMLVVCGLVSVVVVVAQGFELFVYM
jgi:hypothetical protein